jgi:two-component system, sensor histidine kinase
MLMKNPAVGPASDPSTQSGGSTPAKILITEDELIVALDLQVRLKRLGYDVVGIASSGDDAILQVQDRQPDLVLMDIMLHGEMDGVEASQLITKECDVPVIFLTANADQSTLERAGATYPFSYLIKPFKERELKFSIDMALYHHSTARQLREAHDELEQRVQARTAELAASNTALQNELQQHQKTLAELREAQFVAKCADHAKNEFLATISHELLTPMNGIVGMVEMLMDNAPTPLQREQLGVVQVSADTLLNIINDLLDFSRIEEGTMELSPTAFSVREQIESFLSPLISRAQEKALRFSWYIETGVPEQIVADHARIGQVLINLVSNAIKFTERGGIDVRIAKISQDECRAYLRFSIRDTGIGVPEDKQKVIFEPFVQADSSFSRRYGGTGLGLSISARLVSMMGGTIELESKSGAGSTFHFDLWADLVGAPCHTGANL